MSDLIIKSDYLTPVLPRLQYRGFKTVKKGWGSEEWLNNDSDYCIKILNILKNKQCSFHFHVIKKETFFVIEGRVRLRLKFNLKEEEYILSSGQFITIPRLVIHQFFGVEDSKILECSTLHRDDDSIRVEAGDSQK